MIKLIIENQGNKQCVTFLNPYSYLLARKQKELFAKFCLKIDGLILVKVLGLFGYENIKRESFDMTSLAPVVFNETINNQKTIYFIGTEEHLIELSIDRIRDEFENLNIIGFRNGYIEDSEYLIVVSNIVDLNPDIVICGMGTPRQEQFLASLTEKGWKGKGYTCGGFLHQTANGIAYYPKWIDRLNLRAFFRMYDEPKLIKRYFIDYPFAIVIIIYDIIKYKIHNS